MYSDLEVYESIWWENVPNARKFIDSIVEGINNCNNLCISIPKDIPWYHAWKSIIQENTDTSVRDFKFINASEFEGLSVGEIIMKNCFKQGLRNQYRSSIGFEKFIATHDEQTILPKRYIWITNVSNPQVWIDFVNKYYTYNLEAKKATFIIEVMGDNVKTINSTKHVKTMALNSYISDYDISMFCNLMVSDMKCSRTIREYLAELTAKLCNNDLELAVEILNLKERFLKDPIENFESLTSDTTIDKNIIVKTIWAVQLKVFFPMIEAYKIYFIDHNRKLFPDEIYYTNVFGEVITNIYDLELRDITGMYYSKDAYLEKSHLETIQKLHEYRNTLAHVKILSYDEITKLMEIVSPSLKNKSFKV